MGTKSVTSHISDDACDSTSQNMRPVFGEIETEPGITAGFHHLQRHDAGRQCASDLQTRKIGAQHCRLQKQADTENRAKRFGRLNLTPLGTPQTITRRSVPRQSEITPSSMLTKTRAPRMAPIAAGGANIAKMDQLICRQQVMIRASNEVAFSATCIGMAAARGNTVELTASVR